jgi:DNA-binding LacI/PurR family transcriptional regulator
MLSRTTLKDIAARAGVSVSTVSRVLRGDQSRPVEPATEERIRLAARELDYRPNLLARSLAQKESMLISHRREVGVVLGRTSYKYSDPFFSRVIEGIDAEILARGLRLRFVYSLAELEDDQLRGEMVRPDIVSGVIGVVLRAPALAQLAASGVAPVVVIEGPELYQGIDYVSIDKEGGVQQLMEHLWGLGHRRFGYIGPPEEERFRRFRVWMALNGAVDPLVVDTRRSWDMPAGYTGMQQLLQSPRERWPTAVMAACDTLAIGALRAARELGVEVPRDLTVVGFDNTLGAYASPALTSVSVQCDQLGRMAVRRLIERQQHPDEPITRVVMATALVVRESSGPPRDDTALQPMDAAPLVGAAPGPDQSSA